MRTRATTTLTAALLLALAACSSNGDDTDADAAPKSSKPAAEQPSTTPTPAEAAELERAVRDYTAAYFKGDADTAYGTLSKRCAGKITAADYAAVVKQAHADYGTGHDATSVKAAVSGDLARVSYKVDGIPKFDQEAQPWAREGGAWKFDAC
ncbi:hypothetical protein AB9Q10_16350 [Streptomyces krungchingensis]|uniref:hypothetical protein n=1 Tax=Streptomyces krungchingensis TaxID=1565034 RepID=UPI003CEAFADB